MRADVYALAAADTFKCVGVLCGIDAHFAGSFAPAAAVAGVFVFCHLKDGDAVEKGVERAQGAYVFAERSEDENACENDYAEHARLPGEHCAEEVEKAGVGEGEQYARKSARWAQIFAEKRCEFDKERQDDDEEDENGVFYPPQVSVASEGSDFFEKRNFIKKKKKKAEGAQEAADESACERTEEDEKTENVIRESELLRAERTLERADGAGARGGGAGVAVETGHADVFCGGL